MLGVMATIVMACFCLGPTVVPESVPVSHDVAVVRDAIPQSCLANAKAWSHRSIACPVMPAADRFTLVGARPLLLFRVR